MRCPFILFSLAFLSRCTRFWNVFMCAFSPSYSLTPPFFSAFLTHHSLCLLLPSSLPYGSHSLPSSPISSSAYFPNAFFVSASIISPILHFLSLYFQLVLTSQHLSPLCFPSRRQSHTSTLQHPPLSFVSRAGGNPSARLQRDMPVLWFK